MLFTTQFTLLTFSTHCFLHGRRLSEELEDYSLTTPVPFRVNLIMSSPLVGGLMGKSMILVKPQSSSCYEHMKGKAWIIVVGMPIESME